MSPKSPLLPQVAGARVLIVEDESIIAKDIEVTLKGLGYRVCGTADTGPGAISLIEETQPDVILMDVLLRGELDGIEAAREIQERFRLPVVFLTAYADEATLRRAETTEPFGYILKPFDERELHVALVMALCRHKAYAEVEERVRQRTEDLARSEERFRLLVDCVRDYSILMLDAQGYISSWNQGAERITGYTSGEILGQHFSCFYLEEDKRADSPARALRVAEAEGRYEEEGWRVRKGGALFWSNDVITAIRDGLGHLRGFAKVTQDRSEQQRTQEELSKSELRFRATFHQAAVGIAHVALDGHWLRLNQRYSTILGYTEEELRGLTFGDVTHPEDLDADLEHVRQLLSGKIPTYTIEKRYLRKDRGIIWVLLTVSLVRTPAGEPDYFIAVAENITRRREAERNLAFLSETSRVLVESQGTPRAILTEVARMAVTTLADACTFYGVEETGELRLLAGGHSKALVERQGEVYGERGLRPDPAHPFFTVLRSGRALLVRDVAPALLQCLVLNEAQLEQMTITDIRNVMIVPLSAHGARVGVMALAREGQSFHAEEMVLCEDLGRRAAAALETARLYREAQEAIRLRDEFLSVASHELKTPLTSLSLRMQALDRETLRQPASPYVQAVQDYILTGRKQLQRLDALVMDLLDVTRIRAGRFSLDPQEVDLAEVVREVADRLAPEASRMGTPLGVEVTEPLIGRWDRLRLAQVVENLLTNALKYGAGRPVQVLLQSLENGARLIVRDQGIGIAQELQERIFAPFVRGVSERHYGGLGLGLHIVSTIVEALGGTIRVESMPGQGATFIVEFPFQQVQANSLPSGRESLHASSRMDVPGQ